MKNLRNTYKIFIIKEFVQQNHPITMKRTSALTHYCDLLKCLRCILTRALNTAYGLMCACEPEFLYSFVGSLLHSRCYHSLGIQYRRHDTTTKKKNYTHSHLTAHIDVQTIYFKFYFSRACFMHVISSLYTMLTHHTKIHSQSRENRRQSHLKDEYSGEENFRSIFLLLVFEFIDSSRLKMSIGHVHHFCFTDFLCKR